MSDTSKVSKLAELRLKTDRQLAGLIDSALERGLRLSELASTTSFVTGSGSPRVRAERCYAENLVLWSKVEDPGERWRLERKLERLRAALNELRPIERRRVQAASCAQTNY